MKLLVAVAMLCLLAVPALAGPGDTAVDAKINVDSKNKGTITSIGGVEAKTKPVKLKVGNVENTETNVHSVNIKKGAKVKGEINVKGQNKGTITNVGSKVNVGTVNIGN